MRNATIHPSRIILPALFAALTMAGAFIRIPIPGYPVPLTLQTFFVILAGLMLTPGAAAASQAAYVVLGLIGVPVFTAGGGPGYILNPSFGFLLGFVAAAPLISWLYRRISSKGKAAAIACAAGAAAIYVFGMSHMALLGLAAGGKFWPLLVSSCLLFLPLDIAKSIAASVVSISVEKRLRNNV
ncbi:MAG: biotin transporter BioY [Christensenellales bacterium]